MRPVGLRYGSGFRKLGAPLKGPIRAPLRALNGIYKGLGFRVWGFPKIRGTLSNKDPTI